MVKNKAKRENFTRWIIGLILTGIIVASIYLLKKSELVPSPSQNKKTLPFSIKEKTVSVNLYFSDSNSDYLIPEQRRVAFIDSDIKDQVKKILEELIKGSRRDLIQTIPSGVVIRDVEIKKGGVAVINFSQELSQNHPGGSLAEMQTIYSIVNSIGFNIPTLKEIQILIEGKVPETLKGHIDLRSPLTPNPSVIKKR